MQDQDAQSQSLLGRCSKTTRPSSTSMFGDGFEFNQAVESGRVSLDNASERNVKSCAQTTPRAEQHVG